MVDRDGPAAMNVRKQSAVRYEIRVQGILDEHWSGWFGGFTVRSEGGDLTVIAGIVSDQAALHGLLTKVSNVGLSLSRFIASRIQKARPTEVREASGALSERCGTMAAE